MMQELNLRASAAIQAQQSAIAEAMVTRQYQLRPDLIGHYGEHGREKCLQDAGYHLSSLSQAIAVSRPVLFADYIAWAKAMLAGRGIPAEDLATNLECMRDVLQQLLPEEVRATPSAYIEAGLAQLPQFSSTVPTFIVTEEPWAELAQHYLDLLLRGERHNAYRLILKAVKDGARITDIYLQVFQRAQHEIGRLWQLNQVSVAQEHYCTAATQLIMSQLYPYICATEKNAYSLVTACVSGELHEIGSRMVTDLLEMDGWNTFYVGASTSTPSLLSTLAERKADVLSISATLTFHVHAVTEVIAAVRASEAGKRVKILVGGRPFNIAPDLWQQVGADASARDADEAIVVANRLVAEKA